jgi:hypothetical protein
MKAFNVYLNGSLIDTVYFMRSFTAREVRRSLIDHDGLPEAIIVVSCP